MGVGVPESTERGALTEAVYYILLSLCEPRHGYGVMQNIEALSAGRVVLGPGTLYGALTTLIEKRWIEALVGPKNARKKEYVITATGREVLRGEIVRLEELLANGEAILGGDPR
jgi:DNA-binding PadR family transcriptional regulator